ncbi:hypothetical protein EVAR_21102_1 [Eumeta japonica]|uniref:Uncharacterized protein n=1 Tax=Eumeta variegata TaxID=151549 RepID=A0A4C1V008_EUMVA|nr:hypothetical protein EVAR_21102_1 [Eumeta japonica]
MQLLGVGDCAPELWHNVSVPSIVTYARGEQHAQAVGFIRAVAARLPHSLLLYNLGLTSHSYNIITNYCNSSKCIIIDFNLDAFPSHVSDENIHAYRPLIIQHALSRTGGVVFADNWQRWVGDEAQLRSAWTLAAGEGRAGVAAWARRTAVTSLTHPRMFHYLHARLDDFLFVPMVDVSRMMVARSATLDRIMKRWIQCALTLDCIMPIGAQSGGCRFDKKPQYRYSGCHGQDASALSIILGLHFGFEEAQYTVRPRRVLWRRATEAAALAEFTELERNTTEEFRSDRTSDHALTQRST